jgi:hypothetical protein
LLLPAALVLACVPVAGAQSCIPVVNCPGPGEPPAPSGPAPVPQPNGPAKVRVAGSLTTVLLDRPTPGGLPHRASLSAARNEFESFQVVVDAEGPLRNVSVVNGGPLEGPGKATIPAANLTIYRAAAYRVGNGGTPPSDSEGGPGLWPDALIPARDYFYGERRNAFPVDLMPGEKLVAWVDVLVPRRQPPGAYRGSVSVRDSRGALAEVPVKLRVRRFEIPSRASLPSSFGNDFDDVCEAHTNERHCRGDRKKAWRLQALYARAGLENRMTLSSPFAIDSASAPRTEGQGRHFGRFLAPLITGTSPDLRLRGARLTAVNISWHCLDRNNGCLRGWRALARRYRFADRFSLYLCDEPLQSPSAWAFCRSVAEAAGRQWPGVRLLVTASIEDAREFAGPGLNRRIDIIVPVVNDIVGFRGSGEGGNRRPDYNAYLSSSRRGAKRALWLYTSCRSHGCSGVSIDNRETVGLPGYAIDAPAPQARAMGWLAFQYRASGELYYDTTDALDSAWTDQYQSGGHGDGTLFYPGSPRGIGDAPAIGGRHDIPIESIRLKRLRDGREDFEYLRILAARGRRGAAVRVATGLFGPLAVAMRNTDVSPKALNRARARLAALISRRR